MDVTQCIPSSTVAKPFLWKRDQIASALVRAKAMADTGVSQERRAMQLDVPRSTLQNWERNRQRLNQEECRNMGTRHFNATSRFHTLDSR